ncbi:hypothetical protein NEPAR06_0878 [Nematocida parisii]|nr:uncharacterized protein NEPG_02321 [Nematocida parisii ERTm1]EIJ92922.1 hypothetical protein NEPG_02321 [Nematocida parisii ERTm1]KAI5144031.1 hypothetical protein NEPAR07_1008 [Nematocida parisii]KAI5154101.1 hypothetical protein NEPAR06_0878 [Nematocida parisii]KAI5157541.1 hypothetical protein NEPAR05_1368 [Nematocida parisii]|eukprot:XP_013060148.1 hypothetical protein NEPG_02321 [Nematocida parisii ERTm1]
MRACIIITIILVIYYVRAKLTLTDLECIENYVIDDPVLGEIVVNSDGFLNFLRGYIYQQTGLMHNKRFFSSEINISHHLTRKDTPQSPTGLYVFKREVKNDKSHAIEGITNKKEKYLSGYHKRLILMFPSTETQVSIETGRDDAFIKWLRHESVHEHAHKILATLLLLGEGVSINVEIDEKEKKVLEVRKSDGTVYFSVSMKIKQYNKEKGEVIDMYQSETSKIIRFFKRYQKSVALDELSEFTKPKSYEELKEGHFLNGIQFLIETYIYEFTNTDKEAYKIIQAVHTLLIDKIRSVESKNQEDIKIAENVLLSCFEKKCSITKSENIQSLKLLDKEIQKYKISPFSEAEQVPVNIQVPSYPKTKKDFIEDKDKFYTDCVETALLTTFCCLAYDKKTQEYTTKHMNCIHDVNEFFSMNRTPYNKINLETHMQWCKSTVYLEGCDRIYKKEGNEIISGILNYLLAFASMANKSAQYTDKILEFIKAVGAPMEDCKGLLKQIGAFAKNILLSLAFDKTIEVMCYDLMIKNNSIGIPDVFGDILLKYKTEQAEETVTLCFSRGHAHVYFLSNSNLRGTGLIYQIKSVLNAKTANKSSSKFIDHLTQYCINSFIDRFSGTLHQDLPKKEIESAVMNNGEGINKILMKRKINDTVYKIRIANCALIYSSKTELSKEDRISRFISNILGSARLNNSENQKKAFTGLAYIKNQNIYDSIELEHADFTQIPCDREEMIKIIGYALETNSDDILIRCLEVSIQFPSSFQCLPDHLIVRRLLIKIFKQLLEKDAIEHIKTIRNCINKHWKKDRSTHKKIALSLFVYVCEEKGDSLELITETYKLLPDWTTEIFLRYTRTQDNYATVLKTLEIIKKSTPSTEEEREKIESLIECFNLFRKRPSLY